MSRSRDGGLTLLIASSIGAILCCSRPAPSQLVRDSAGVRIVESTAPRWTPAQAWRVDPVPIAEMGTGRDPNDLFTVVTGAVIIPPGRVAVGDESSRSVLVFDLAGNFVKRWGRPGSGPGDFRFVGALQLLPGDSVLIGDTGLGVGLWTKEGRFVRRTRMPIITFANGMATPGVIGRMPSGHFVAGLSNFLLISQRVGRRMFHSERSLLIVTPGPEVVARIGPLPFGDRFAMGVDGITVSDTAPFAATSTVRVFGARVYVSSGASFEVSRYDATGALREVYRRTVKPRPVGEPEQSAFRRWYVEDIERRAQSVEAKGNQESGRLTRRLRPVWLKNVPFPASAPVIANFVVDARGYIWVDDYVMLTDSAATWSILDPEGRYLGSIARPRDIQTLFASDTLIVGLAQDEDEVHTIRVYRVRGRDLVPGASSSRDGAIHEQRSRG